MPTIEKQVSVNLTVRELAVAFAGLYGDEQADFFAEVASISNEWPGTGWCQQSCDIAAHLTPDGREVVRTLAGYALDRDDL